MKIFIMISLVILISACKSGDGEGLDQQGRPIEEVITGQGNEGNEETDNNSIKPTLTSIQAHIFTPICATCHGGASPAAGQDLSSIENSINNLINIASSNPSFKRVLPGAALESYLYLKIIGDSQAGSRMPLGQPALSEEMSNAIKEWIDQGAVVPESSNTPALVSRVHRQEKNKSALSTEDRTKSTIGYQQQKEDSLVILLWFNRAMNFESLTAKNFIVTATNESALTENNSWFLNDQHLSLKIIDDHKLQVNLSKLSSEITHINIQLNNSTISTLTTHLGKQLDGNEDGEEGGVFNYELAL